MDDRIPTQRNLTGSPLHYVGPWKHPAKPAGRPGLIRGILIGFFFAVGVIAATAMVAKAHDKLMADLRTVCRIEVME